MFILTMTSIAGRFLSTSHSEYLIFVQAYMSQLLTLLDHFDCYFLYLFLTAILYFLLTHIAFLGVTPWAFAVCSLHS